MIAVEELVATAVEGLVSTAVEGLVATVVEEPADPSSADEAAA